MIRQRGVALVIVLWGVLLLAVLTGSVVVLTRAEIRLVESHIEKARRSAILDSAVAWATQRLLDGRPQQRLPTDGTPTLFEFDAHQLEVSATLEGGRIDLNASDDDLLKALFQAQWISEQEAEAWLDKLRDWQDADDERRLRGAEFADYRAAGQGYGPRNGPLKSVEELQLLLGMPRTLAACVGQAATVYTGAATPDLLHLVPAARAVLTWSDHHGSTWLSDQTAVPTEVSSLAGQVVRLRIAPRSGTSSTGSVIEVIGRLAGGTGRSWASMAVRELDATGETNCAASPQDGESNHEAEQQRGN